MNITEAEYRRIMARQGKPEKRVAALPCPSEAQEQEAVIAWARCNIARLPGLELLFHVPNGGERPMHAALAMARQGVQSGVPDLLLPVARGGYHGLWLELKKRDGSNHPSPAQHAWLTRLEAEGYRCVVAYGAAQAIEAITHYLEMRP